MEILATHVQNARGPAELQRSEFAHLLRPGRVLAGLVTEVTPTEALLRVGPFTLTAQSHPGLEAGQHLLLQVADTGGSEGLMLRLLGGGAGEESLLLRTLRSVLSSDRPLGDLLTDLARRLAGGTTRPSPEAAAFLERLGAHAFRPGATGAELAQLLRTSGLVYEASLLDAALKGADRELVARLTADLKAQLLTQLQGLEAGPVRDAVARTLAGLEAEQLLNVARQDAGEPLHFSLPVPDEGGWATAHLFWSRRDDDSEGSEGNDAVIQRLSIGVRFSKTGPVRVDAVLRPDLLALRIRVETEPVAAALEAGLDELRERLASGDRKVSLVVSVAPPSEVELDARSMDIRYLREHHLMDVSG